MPVHNIKSEWVSGNLVFKETVAGNGGSIHFGVDDAGMDMKFFGNTASNYALWDASDDLMKVVTTSAETTGNLRSSQVEATFTAAATLNSIEAFASIVTANVQTGNWCNAILGKVDYSTSGFVTGLAGAVCAELDMPAATIANGSYACFEAELNVPTNANGWGTTVPVAFMVANAWGAGVAEFRDEGYIFNFTGLGSPGASKIIQANTDQPTHGLRCLIDGTEYFMLMTTVDNGSE